MHYEVVTVINPNNTIWEKQKKRLFDNKGQVISVSPSPNFNLLKAQEKVSGKNLVDQLTRRKHDSTNFLFFDKVSRANRADIFMNEGWSISINHDGDEIGYMELYPNTRRHVKAIEYINQDGTTDFIEEYTDDGILFSNIFYANNKVEQIDFLNCNQLPVLSYFFYEGKNNFVILRDPKTLKKIESYSNIIDCMAKTLSRNVTEFDTVGISYMGIELSVLKYTDSHNILFLEESPLDDKGEIKNNLVEILENKISFVHEVHMDKFYYEQLQKKQVSLNKVVINKDL